MAAAIIDIPGIGPVTAASLAEHGYRTPRKLAGASIEKLASVPGFSTARDSKVIAADRELLSADTHTKAAGARRPHKDKKAKGKDKRKGKGKDKRGKKDKKDKRKGKRGKKDKKDKRKGKRGKQDKKDKRKGKRGKQDKKKDKKGKKGKKGRK